jgi:dUTPase
MRKQKMSDVVEVKLFKQDAIMPSKATKGSAGYDLCVWLKDSYDEQTLITPHSSLIIPTGLSVNIPNGYEIQCRIDSEIVDKYAKILASYFDIVYPDF